MTADKRELRDLLGHFATGVAIVTTCSPQGERAGVTINSFNSVSLSPELILFSLTRSLFSLPVFEAADAYAVNFLAADQEQLSRKFSSRGGDKWRDTGTRVGSTGSILIEGSIAHIECSREQVIDAGDHRLFLCGITSFSIGEPKHPLLFFKGHYFGLAPQQAHASS